MPCAPPPTGATPIRTITTELPNNILKPLVPVCGKGDSRYSMAGVLIECSADGLSLSATDGCCAVVVSLPDRGTHGASEAFKAVIPSRTIRDFRPGRAPAIELALSRVPESGASDGIEGGELRAGGASLAFRPDDAKACPPLADVLPPRNESGAPMPPTVQLHPDRFATVTGVMAGLSKLFSKRSPAVPVKLEHQSPDRVVSFWWTCTCPRVTIQAVLMPLRDPYDQCDKQLDRQHRRNLAALRAAEVDAGAAHEAGARDA